MTEIKHSGQTKFALIKQLQTERKVKSKLQSELTVYREALEKLNKMKPSEHKLCTGFIVEQALEAGCKIRDGGE